jgi:hypothetical protein
MPAAASSRFARGTSARASENSAQAITQRATRALGGQLPRRAILRAQPAAGARPRPVERLHHGAAEHQRPKPRDQFKAARDRIARRYRPRRSDADRRAPLDARGQPDPRRSTGGRAKIGALGLSQASVDSDPVGGLGRQITSTTSSTAAGSSASMSRAMRQYRSSARGHRRLVSSARRKRADGRPSRRSRRSALVERADLMSCTSTASPRTRSQADVGAGEEHRRGDEADRGNGRQDPRRVDRMERRCPIRSACPRARRRSSMACRCWSCSCAWPRSTRAGRSRSRCC